MAKLLYLNFCMYAVVLGISSWAINTAIDHPFDVGTASSNQTGKAVDLPPPHFSPIYFPMGNAATGYFVVFALIAAAVGLASAMPGFDHVYHEGSDTLPAATAAGILAWALTLLATGFAAKEIHLKSNRNGRLRTMEAFLIILSATQLFYVAALRRGVAGAQKK